MAAAAAELQERRRKEKREDTCSTLLPFSFDTFCNTRHFSLFLFFFPTCTHGQNLLLKAHSVYTNVYTHRKGEEKRKASKLFFFHFSFFLSSAFFPFGKTSGSERVVPAISEIEVSSPPPPALSPSLSSFMSVEKLMCCFPPNFSPWLDCVG